MSLIQRLIRNVETRHVPMRRPVLLRMRALLAILLLASLALAGCASNTNSPGSSNDTATTPTSGELTPAAAKLMLDQAAANVPNKFGMAAVIVRGTAQLMTMNASFDNVSKTSYVEMRGDPAAFGSAGEDSAAAAAIFANGFSIYSTKEGSLYMANGTAFVFPPSNESGKGGSLVPSPESSAFGKFLNPEDAVGAFEGSNVTVQSVTATQCHGQGAARIVFLSTENGQNVTATADVLNTNPARLCHVETTLPADKQNPADPLANANFRADFYYNDELKLDTPESVSRAIGLLYASSKPSFSFGGDAPTNYTWTFANSAGIALAEVEVQVKDTSNESSSANGAPDLAAQPTLFAMKLSEGTKTQDGITLTFHDKDGDGKVSKGDTLDVAGPSGEPAPTVVMKDLKTGIYVVPGFELVLLVGALAAAVLLVRRR